MKSKTWFLLTIPLLVGQAACGQQKNSVSREAVKQNITYLASDELRGRGTGDRGNDMAAQFIAGKFKEFGLIPLPGMTDFFQSVYLKEYNPPKLAELKIGTLLYQQTDNLVVVSGENTQMQADWIWSDYRQDVGTDEIQNKILITRFGFPDENSLQKNINRMDEKGALAQMKGARAVVELLDVDNATWLNIVGYLRNFEVHINEDPITTTAADFIHILVHEKTDAFRNIKKHSAQIIIQGLQHHYLKSSNVLGMVSGTDPALQNEYLVLSAHFDHLGIGKPQKLDNGKIDSIYNGARDNAIGVAAVLEAARFFAKNPAKRPIIFVGFTAEELGLLGSKWYVEHPLIPLNQTIFNLNIDGAGYNDTSMVSIVGLNRTSANKWLTMAGEQEGFKIGTDPTPGKFLFNASDNLNFAQRGVPCVTFSEGFDAFDDEIKKYYHQVTDESDNLNYNYVSRFCEAFIDAAKLIADDPQKPAWTEGDFYEQKGKSLYSN